MFNESDTPPINLSIKDALPPGFGPGWSFQVTDVHSKPGEAYWVIVYLTPSNGPSAPEFVTTTNQCGSHTVVAGQTDTWGVQSLDASGTPTLSVSGLPPGGTFSPGDDGTGQFQFAPNSTDQGGVYPITVTSTYQNLTATLTCQETIEAVGPAAPNSSSIGGQVIGGGRGIAVLISDTTGSVLISLHTDSAGTFLIGGLPAGLYTVSISVPPLYVANAPTSATVTLDGSNAALVDFSILGPVPAGAGPNQP